MAIYGFVRHSLLKKEKLAEGQIAEMARKAEELGGSLKGVFVDPGSTGKKTAILSRPAGKEMLETLQAGDTLIVNGLDRLGCSMRDVHKTVETLAEREVRIHVLRALDGELELDHPQPAKTSSRCSLLAETEKALRSERATEAAQSRKENGRAYGGVPMARKIVERDGVKVLEWDMEQLEYIAEIARRLPKEGPAKVAKDFWKREIKDRRGPTWGKQTPRPKPQALRSWRCWLGPTAVPHPLPAVPPGGAMVPPHEAQGPVAAPLRRTGAVDAGAERFSGGAQAEEVDAGGNGTAGTRAGRLEGPAPRRAAGTVAEGEGGTDTITGP